MSPQTRIKTKRTLLAALIVLTVAFGVLVRWEEPASTRVIPAEDPYTHMALVRNHLSDGDLDPLVDGGELYPPGMHAVLAAAYSFTGLDWDDLFRFGPVVFGAVSVIGIALLLWRTAGPGAALVGSLAIALSPELVFRTQMMAPTAVDLAIMPFLFITILETMRGRLAWTVPLGVMTVFLALAHPWLLIIMAPVTLGIVMLALLLDRRGDDAPVINVRAFGAGVALLTVGVALLASISICWNQCGLGFQNIGEGGNSLDKAGALAGAAAVVVGAAMMFVGKRRRDRQVTAPPLPMLARWVLSALAAVLLVAITIPAAQNGMPDQVELPRMFGWPVLILAAIGLVAVPLLRWPAGWAGAALFVVTYPFVIYNPLESPYWPHRTAAYLGVGLVIMAGIGAAAIGVAAHRLGAVLPVSRHSARVSAGVALALTAFILSAGSVYAGTPKTYETGWYRLYHECEFDAIHDLASSADAQTVIITGDWRPKLVAAAFAPDAENVWYSESFFLDPGYREDTSVGLAVAGKEVYVVVDRHLLTEHRDYDTAFLQGSDWVQEGAYCDEGLAQARLSVYRSVIVP